MCVHLWVLSFYEKIYIVLSICFRLGSCTFDAISRLRPSWIHIADGHILDVWGGKARVRGRGWACRGSTLWVGVGGPSGRHQLVLGGVGQLESPQEPDRDLPQPGRGQTVHTEVGRGGAGWYEIGERRRGVSGGAGSYRVIWCRMVESMEW